MEYFIKSESELDSLCEKLKPFVIPNSVWFLKGDLGAGKTTFVSHMCKLLESGSAVSSPTFTLINHYQADVPIIHVDLYRVKTKDDFYGLDFERYCSKGAALFIEWPDIIPNHYFDNHYTISFEYQHEGRLIKVTGPIG